MKLTCAVLVLAAGAAFAQPQAPQAPSQPPKQPAPAADSGAAERLKSVRAFVRSEIDANHIVGAVVYARGKGETAAHRLALGFADRDAKVEMVTDQLFQIASMTKSITATVVVMLADQGKLDLDTPIDAYLPEFKDIKLQDGSRAEPPTLRQLLSHQGGAPGNNDRNALFREETLDRSASLEENIKALAASGLAYQPGARYAYSGLGYSIAARVAEKVSGKDFETLCRTMLFEPLGMTRTTFHPSASELARLAHGYRRTERDEWREMIQFEPPAPGGYINAGGGLYSTVDDLARFYQFHLDGGKVAGKTLVSAEALEAMRTRQTELASYGLGFQLDPAVETDSVSARFWHGGATGTLGFADADAGLAGIVLTQTPSAQSRSFLQGVQERILAAYGIEPGAEGGAEGQADPRMVLQGNQGTPGRGLEQIFESMDKDGDERISREEWTRRPAGFDIIDADKDGFISKAEVEAMMERLRPAGNPGPRRRPGGG